MVFIASLAAVNFAPYPGLGDRSGVAAVALIGAPLRASAAAGREPLFDLTVARRRIFWVAAVAG